jgi:hypothetical protein
MQKASEGGPAVGDVIRILVCAAAGLVWASCGGAALVSDAGRAASHTDGGDGRAAPHTDGGDGPAAPRNDGGDGQCAPSGSLPAEPSSLQVMLDGGVPLAEFPTALAIARCGYWSRCFGVATYLANECADTLAGGGVWRYGECSRDGSVTSCSVSTFAYDRPSPALLQAAAGAVRYDAQRAALCVGALLAQGCSTDRLVEQIPICDGVLTCAAPDGGLSADRDGGLGNDGGPSCASLVPPWGWGAPAATCSTDQDCVAANYLGGAFCLGGVCGSDPCLTRSDRCDAVAWIGQPCDGTATTEFTEGAPIETATTCSPGLACQRANGDGGGGNGICIAPLDVGGACTARTDCEVGLVCACGLCQIPPRTGACVDGLCEIGVAYCDLGSDLCRPVRHAGDSCLGEILSCEPGLACDISSSTCQPD